MLSESYGEYWFTYTGPGFSTAAASIAYWPLTQLTEHPTKIGPIELYTYHHVAYHEPPGRQLLFIFSEPGAESATLRSISTAQLMGAKVIAITPPLPPTAQQYIDEERTIAVEVSSQRPSIVFLALAAGIAVELAKRFSKVRVRVERVQREYVDLASALEWVSQHYGQSIEELRDSLRGGCALYCSPTLVGACSFIAQRAAEKGFGRPMVLPLTSITPDILAGTAPRNVVAVSTGAESDLGRAASMRARMTGRRLVELTINTDPLTAPLYASLIAELL